MFSTILILGLPGSLSSSFFQTTPAISLPLASCLPCFLVSHFPFAGFLVILASASTTTQLTHNFSFASASTIADAEFLIRIAAYNMYFLLKREDLFFSFFPHIVFRFLCLSSFRFFSRLLQGIALLVWKHTICVGSYQVLQLQLQHCHNSSQIHGSGFYKIVFFIKS